MVVVVVVVEAAVEAGAAFLFFGTVSASSGMRAERRLRHCLKLNFVSRFLNISPCLHMKSEYRRMYRRSNENDGEGMVVNTGVMGGKGDGGGGAADGGKEIIGVVVHGGWQG